MTCILIEPLTNFIFLGKKIALIRLFPSLSDMIMTNYCVVNVYLIRFFFHHQEVLFYLPV